MSAYELIGCSLDDQTGDIIFMDQVGQHYYLSLNPRYMFEHSGQGAYFDIKCVKIGPNSFTLSMVNEEMAKSEWDIKYYPETNSVTIRGTNGFLTIDHEDGSYVEDSEYFNYLEEDVSSKIRTITIDYFELGTKFPLLKTKRWLGL